tara:strand:- start:182 stop:646 length:465 start_codon:yes stop_codon:yes gene_type:complete
MKLKTNLSLDVANKIIDFAIENGREQNLLPLTIVILDSGGKIIVSKSEDGSSNMRFEIAYGKAWGALGLGMSSRLIADKMSSRPNFLSALASVSKGKFIPVPGGVLIEDAEGFTIGAVGISGDASEKDEYCAINAVKKSGLFTEPGEIDSSLEF